MTRASLFVSLALLLAACGPTSSVVPAEPPAAPRASAWLQHDTARPAPPRVTPPAAQLPAPAPSDAVVLIPPDGSSLDAWERPDGGPAPWTIAEGAVVIAPGTGPIQTKASFGDLQLHIEWRAADEPEKTSQDRSNSGVFLLDGRYEIQILDTYENETYADGMAGALYGQYPPLANALRPPGEWQAYDIFFRGPRFGPDGTLETPARVTVLQNGVLVQNNEVLAGPTVWLETLPYEAHPQTGKIQLQDHGSPVRFRNLWVRETPERPAPPPGYGQFAAVRLSDAELDGLVGTYERPGGDQFIIERTDTGLGLALPWRPGVLRMIPLSPTLFQLANTAGQLRFTLDEAGDPTELIFEMGGGTYRATPAAE